MADSNDTREMVKALDAERMGAMVAGDLEALERILADDLSYVHTSAAIDTKSSILESIGNGRLNYQKMAARNVKVRDYGNTAVVRGEADVEVTSGRERPDILVGIHRRLYKRRCRLADGCVAVNQVSGVGRASQYSENVDYSRLHLALALRRRDLRRANWSRFQSGDSSRSRRTRRTDVMAGAQACCL